LSASDAIELVQSWLDQPCATVIDPTERHAAVLRELLLPLGAPGNLTTDAHLAALAIEHGAQLCSSDTDFAPLRRPTLGRPAAGQSQAIGAPLE